MNRAMSTKDQLLIGLKRRKGAWISGEALAQEMAISRSAVWKHICALKDEGYVVESSRKKGYLLRELSSLLLPNEIQEGLNTNVFGKRKIAYFTQTDSTNLRAKDLAHEGAPEGTVVVAEKQIQGRGRRGRSWFSPLGEGIYASIIMRPLISPNEAPGLTLMASVAVAEAIQTLTSLNVHIKWPNDIMIYGRKVAGILTEISTEMDRVDYVIVGLGMNVNISHENFPPDLRDKATSILMETGKTFPRVTLLRAYLEEHEKYYELFTLNGFGPVLNRWKQLADIIGRRITVDLMEHRYTGEVLDIDREGFLILRDHEGRMQRIISGDVTLLND